MILAENTIRPAAEPPEINIYTYIYIYTYEYIRIDQTYTVYSVLCCTLLYTVT